MRTALSSNDTYITLNADITLDDHTAPAMDVVTFEHRANLLQASEEMPQNMGVDWDGDYGFPND